MQKLYDTVLNGEGQPIQGATVTIYETGTSTLAQLYQDDGVTGKTNPLTTDAYGLWECLVDDGTYDLVVAYGSESNRVDKVAVGSGFDPSAPGAIGDGTPGTGAFTDLQAETLELDEGVAIVAVLDEDDMASDRDDAVPTQASVKTYVDDAVSGVGASAVEAYTTAQGSGQTSTSSSFADVTGMSVTLNVPSASSKVRISASLTCGWSVAPSGAGYGWLQLVHVGSGAVVQKILAISQTNGVVNYTTVAFEGEHTPGSSGSHTYKLQFARDSSGTFHVPNQGSGFNNSISARSIG